MGKPTYLPLLNSIAVNEAKGEQLLKTWANATSDPQLKSALAFVAIREGEHAWAFTKRMCELGYEVDEGSAYQVFKNFDDLLACAASGASDADKVEMLTGGDNDNADAKRSDPFRGFFNDTTIDPATGALLGRYIAEERDSGRRLREAYDRVCAHAPAQRNGSESELSELRECVLSLQDDVTKLRKKLKKIA